MTRIEEIKAALAGLGLENVDVLVDEDGAGGDDIIRITATCAPERHWWSTSSGRIELELTADDARCGSHQGPCDDDIADLRRVPYIRDQLDKFGPALLAEELKEWGAWDENELADHDQNLSRILWLACGGIVDELHEHTG